MIVAHQVDGIHREIHEQGHEIYEHYKGKSDCRTVQCYILIYIREKFVVVVRYRM